MKLVAFNQLSKAAAQTEFAKCCGASKWVNLLVEKMPFLSMEQLKLAADECWKQCNTKDYLEAFSHHPKIGDRSSLEQKFATTHKWASSEQSSVKDASATVIDQLAEANEAYEKKFGYIFIVCATGKSAEEMLKILTSRLANNPQEEILIAAAEQNKITHIRINKLLE